MKNSIAWHRKCFINMKVSLQRQEDALTRAMIDIEYTRSQVSFYELQITTAIAKHKDGFDSDKFCKKIIRITSSE